MKTTSGKNGKKPSAPDPTSTRVTIEDVQRIGTFFQKLIESSHLKLWIVLAGVGGVCEVLRVAWDAARFVLKR